MFLTKLTKMQKEALSTQAAILGAEDFMFVKTGADRPYASLLFTAGGEVHELRMTVAGKIDAERFPRQSTLPADAVIPAILLGQDPSPIDSDADSHYLFERLYHSH